MWQTGSAGRAHALRASPVSWRPEWREREAVAQAAAYRRLAAGLLLLLLLTACLLLSLRPRHLYLNGQITPLAKIGTAADGVRLLGLSLTPGDRVDVQGHTVVREGGLPPLLMRNGQSVTPDEVIRGGDCLTVVPARDVREPVDTKVRLLAPVLRSAAARRAAAVADAPGVGLRRVERGHFSGKIALVETTQAAPLVATGSAKRKLIALTFDDGPSPSYTPSILAILKQHAARATFFELGICAVGHQDLVRAVVAGGHEIAVHSWNHPQLTKLGSAQVQDDLRRCLELFHKIVGPDLPLHWMRPPYGATNASVRASIEAVGLKQILWNVDTNDWRRPGASVIYQRLMNGARDGAVVLMHDGGGPREGTVEAVRQAVPALIAKGYELVTLSEMMDNVSPFSGEVIYAIAGESFHVTPILGAAITIDGAQVVYELPLLQCRGQVLVPATPTFARLGTTCRYETATQSLLLVSPSGNYRVRLDSLRLEKNGQEVQLSLPALLYRDRAYVPLWAAMNLTGGQALWDPGRKSLWLYSPGVATNGSGPPPAALGQWITGSVMEG